MITIRIVLACVLGALAAGCGSGMALTAVPKAAHYQIEPKSVRQILLFHIDFEWTPRLLLQPTRADHVVLGWLELRAPRRVSPARLMNRLLEGARKLKADAIQPVAQRTAAGRVERGSANPYIAYYVDAGTGEVVLEAHAIRYARYTLIGGKRRSASTETQLQALALESATPDCIPILIDLPSGPLGVNVLLGPKAEEHGVSLRDCWKAVTGR